MVKIKGYEFKEVKVRDSYNRRALKFKNNIINSLKLFGITEDDIEIPLETVAMKKAQATVSWYMWDEHLLFSYNGSGKFVENLAMIAKVIDHYIQLLSENEITKEEMLEAFVEDEDILKQRKEAREVLGVEEDSTDFDEMHKKFKKLSKEHHPDMPNGDTETFQKLNRAHKILKRESS
ncbi:MAG: DnaJ domain-containing protein [Nanoarchaeota archaeon]|nr:DnaJ domain-containing protein [Nanoarchaeota archaeon]